MAENYKDSSEDGLDKAKKAEAMGQERLDEIRNKLKQNRKRTFEMFESSEPNEQQQHKPDEQIESLKMRLKFKRLYEGISHTPGVLVDISQRNKALKALGMQPIPVEQDQQKPQFIFTEELKETNKAESEQRIGKDQKKAAQQSSQKDAASAGQLVAPKPRNQQPQHPPRQKEEKTMSLVAAIKTNENQIALRHTKEVSGQWHAPWKLHRVISGHTGWVRCIAVDPMNKFFVTGSSDRTIKFWDLVKGSLKITLTGHVNTVRDLAVSDRHPYLFSCGEDKTVKCWDLEQNKVVRQYHGHLSAVYALALHPELDLLVTGGRDSTARVWDMRTKAAVHVLAGHAHTVESILCQSDEPQVITASHDKMIRLWDIRMGRCLNTLTHHKKGVRALVNHPEESAFASAGSDKVRIWKQPDGEQLRALPEQNVVLNALALNDDNVLVSGADDGTLQFYDWTSGKCFQTLQSPVQPGSLSSEAAIFDIKFDRSSLRMITAECDKTIKIWKEDESAEPTDAS